MPALPGDPAVVYAAADTLDTCALALTPVRDDVGAHARAVAASWTGVAAMGAEASIGHEAARILTVVDACRRPVAALRAFADELQRAQQDWAAGEQMADRGRAVLDTVGPVAPAQVMTAQADVTDGAAVMAAAQDRAQVANEAAARALHAATEALAGVLPPLAPPPDGDLADGLRKAAGDVVDEVTGLVGGAIDHLNPFGDRFGATWSNTGQTVQAAVTDPLATGAAMVEGTVAPVVDSYRTGGLDEAIGRSPGVIAGVLGGKGVTKLGALPSPDPAPGPHTSLDGAHTPLAPGGGLQRHEDAGGHTLAPDRAHVGATDQDLLDRQSRNARGPMETSTYPDRQTAERSVHDNVVGNRSAIEQWLRAGNPEPKRFDWIHDWPTGRYAPKNAEGLDEVRDVSSSRVVLVRDTTMPEGYRIQTSFPRP